MTSRTSFATLEIVSNPTPNPTGFRRGFIPALSSPTCPNHLPEICPALEFLHASGLEISLFLKDDPTNAIRSMNIIPAAGRSVLQNETLSPHAAKTIRAHTLQA